MPQLELMQCWVLNPVSKAKGQTYILAETTSGPTEPGSATLPSEFFFFFFCLFAISWAAPAAYGGSQARGRIGAVATGLRQSHSNAGSEPRLQPTPQLTATPDR